MKIIVNLACSSDNGLYEIREVDLSDEEIVKICDRYFELKSDRSIDDAEPKCKHCKWLKPVTVKGRKLYACMNMKRTRSYFIWDKINKGDYDFKYSSQKACKSGFEKKED